MARTGPLPAPRAKQAVVQPISAREAVILSGRRSLHIATDGSIDPKVAWGMLQGGKSTDEIATAIGCDLSPVEAFVEELDGADLLIAAESAVAPSDAFMQKGDAIELIAASGTMWKRHSLMHPLFGLLADDTPRPALMLGLLVETCQYALRLPPLIATAARRLRDPRASAALDEFADEEMLHHEAMAEALAQELDASAETVLASRPSPSLQLLLSFVERTANEQSIAIAAMLSLVEMNDAPAERSADAFLSLADSNRLPRELLAPFADHAREDDALGHGQVAELVLDAALPAEVDGNELNGILNFVHDVKHGLDLVYDQLVARWAESRDRYVLRRPVEWQLL